MFPIKSGAQVSLTLASFLNIQVLHILVLSSLNKLLLLIKELLKFRLHLQFIYHIC